MHDRTTPIEDRVYYIVRNQAVDDAVKQALEQLSKYKNSRNTDYLNKAIDHMKEAIQLSRKLVQERNSIGDKNDLAYCLRKYASMLFEFNFQPSHEIDSDDESHKTHSSADLVKTIIDSLSESLSLFEKENRDHPVIKKIIALEKLRVLDQLRKLAYAAKLGGILEYAANKLISLIDEDQPNIFLIQAYEALFHVEFNKMNLLSALKHTQKAIELATKINADISSHLTHLIKIKIMQFSLNEVPGEVRAVFVKNHIESHFWTVYDQHKQNLMPHSRSASLRIVKDLVLLFTIRCIKLLDGEHQYLSPKEYVLKEGRKLLNTEYYKTLKSVLADRERTITNTHQLFLDYQYFDNLPQPAIEIPENIVERLFALSPSSTNVLHREPRTQSSTSTSSQSSAVNSSTPSLAHTHRN